AVGIARAGAGAGVGITGDAGVHGSDRDERAVTGLPLDLEAGLPEAVVGPGQLHLRTGDGGDGEGAGGGRRAGGDAGDAHLPEVRGDGNHPLTPDVDAGRGIEGCVLVISPARAVGAVEEDVGALAGFD